ncbi:MAG: RraA family protein [Anaerolineae bacterium]
MSEYQNDQELFSLMRQELFPAIVGDVLDRIGYLLQFLPPYIQPLRDDMIVVGRAMPVLIADYLSVQPAGHSEVGLKPYGLLFEALDDLKENEVFITAGGSPNYALWGELLSTRAIWLKAAGAVLDGYSRDTPGILRLDFPTFARGRFAQDQGARGKVIDYRIPIDIGRVRIKPGDIIFGDLDGVLVIPQEVERTAIQTALDKMRTENLVRRSIEDGMSAAAAFEKYGVM